MSRRYWLGVVFILAIIANVSAETWRLNEGSWQGVSQDRQAEYLLAVSEIKQLVSTGQTKKLDQAYDNLKADFPEINGEDMSLFIKAEKLFANGKFPKAVRAYDKLMNEYPNSPLFDVALDRQYDIAMAFLSGEKKTVLKVFKIKGYSEGAKIMERIGDRVGNSDIGMQAATSVANSYERRKKFNDAYLEWSQISSQWPTGTPAQTSLLGMGRCKHAAYKGPRYDDSSLISAGTYYGNYQARYSLDARDYDILAKLEQIKQQIAYKQFSIGQYYQNNENPESAKYYYKMVINTWPQTTAAKMAQEAMATEDAKKEKKWKRKFVEKIEKIFL